MPVVAVPGLGGWRLFDALEEVVCGRRGIIDGALDGVLPEVAQWDQILG